MVEVEIDGIKVEVPEGSMLMEAATKAGKYVPHFCYHKKLSIAANCRMCLVEVEKAPKPLPACATPVSPNMIVRTQSEKAVAAQKSVMEFLLINHPLDCPICDQGGECQLQDIAVGYGGVTSRYQEEKRVVFHKDIGPLVSAQEMSRCIHCTRCVRFGQEVAGVMELGMANRGEHSEILSFVGNSVDSELSGNMIDLCPVGALTSKPFRYSARTWEMARRKTVAAHDSLGSNVVVQVKNDTVMRVLPLENEAINECWISDRDRFSYEGLNSEDRLTQPMIKKNGQWQSVDWQTALSVVAEGFKKARRESENLDGIVFALSPNSTFEELALAKALANEIGTKSVDAGGRHASSLNMDGAMPWLGDSIVELSEASSIVVVGSDLRNDQPLLASRIRQACKQGASVTLVSVGLNDPFMPKANLVSVAPSGYKTALEQDSIVSSLAAADGSKFVLIGQQVLMAPNANEVIATAKQLADQHGAKFGFLGDGANWTGSFVAGAQSCAHEGSSMNEFLKSPVKAALIFGLEPELDSLCGQAASRSLAESEFVVVASPFVGKATEYADVLLPISPFTETSGTFINIEGVVQTFKAAVKPLGETRPGWKVLRVLGNLLGVEAFDQFNSSADVLQAYLPANLTAQLSNEVTVSEGALPAADIELATYAPIYSTDGVVRRSAALQRTAAANAGILQANSNTLQLLGIQAGSLVKLLDNSGGEVQGEIRLNEQVASKVVLVPIGKVGTSGLNSQFGPVKIELVQAPSEVKA